MSTKTKKICIEAEQGQDSYAEKQLERAKSYEYVVEILEKIASEI